MNLRACTGSCSRGPIQLSMVGESHYPISDYNNRLNIKDIGAGFKETKNYREKFSRLFLDANDYLDFKFENNFSNNGYYSSRRSWHRSLINYMPSVTDPLHVRFMLRVDEFPYGRKRQFTRDTFYPPLQKTLLLPSHTTSSSKTISYYRYDTFFVVPSLAVGPLAQQYAIPPDLEIVIQKTRRLYFTLFFCMPKFFLGTFYSIIFCFT